MSDETIEEMKRKINEHMQKSQNILKELVRRAKEIRSIYVDGLGEVRYGVLTFGDLVEISKYQSSEERTIAILYCMLKKADPELTIDDVKSLPLDVATKILTAIGQDTGFLLMAQ